MKKYKYTEWTYYSGHDDICYVDWLNGFGKKGWRVKREEFERGNTTVIFEQEYEE